LIQEWTAARPSLRALILGVTPELCRLPWPAGTILRAVDNSPEMIATLWPGPPEQVRPGNWTELPFADASQDIVVCDGGFHLLAHPAGQTRLASELARVTAPGGLVIFRLFTPPQQKESPAQVFADLAAGAVSDPNELKLRLAQSLQTTAGAGVAVREVWQAVHALAPDLDTLAARLAWDRDALRTLEAYRDRADRYHFVSIAEFEALLAGPGPDAAFRLHAVRLPRHGWGKRCPIVALRRTPWHPPQ
jgi:SAM-dependent methyltransferase